MYYIVFGFLFLLLFLDSKVIIIYILTIIWFLFAIYYYLYIKNSNDDEIETSDMRTISPNNNKSYFIRYLYRGKCDYKCFMLTLIELYLNNSIDIKVIDDNVLFVDNNNPYEQLNNFEMDLKRLLFKEITFGNELSLNTLYNFFKKRSGYSYRRYKEWSNIFLVVCTKMNYFKTNKKVTDKVLLFLVISFILSLYNLLFTRKIILCLIIYFIAVILIFKLNNLILREEESKYEMLEWLKFKNYILKNGLNNLDEKSMECYILYTYALDIYNRRLVQGTYESKLLNLIQSGFFDIINNIVRESIKKSGIKTIALFKK